MRDYSFGINTKTPMKTHKIIFMLAFVLIATTLQAQDANKIIGETVEALGGKKNFFSLKDVNYDLEYRAPKGALTLVAHETYVFHKELSTSTYTEHTLLGKNGKVVEDGKLSTDEQANGVARFLRKTNYYWFAMFFKLQGDGVNLAHTGSKTVNGKAYDMVKVTFGDSVGDGQDTYVLYVNKETKLIDQFLFTVVGFGITEPNLMQVEYETVDGIKIPSKRKYIESNWDGEIKGKEWTTTNWTNIKFNTQVDKSMFNTPTE